MDIQFDKDVPDSTYFTATDVEPTIKDGKLVVFDGRGGRRGWGAPQVTSTIILNESDLTSVHVGFSHKHQGGQGWYHFKDGLRVKWGSLPDTDRIRIIEAHKQKSPGWAKAPGGLKSQAKTPNNSKVIAYKLVKLLPDERMVSLYDGTVEYQIGRRLTQRVRPDHGGGYYAYPTQQGCLDLWKRGTLVPKDIMVDIERLALLEVELSGRMETYSGNKLAATYIRPLRVLSVLAVEPTPPSPEEGT